MYLANKEILDRLLLLHFQEKQSVHFLCKSYFPNHFQDLFERLRQNPERTETALLKRKTRSYQ